MSAPVVKLVNTRDLKSLGEILVGSIPTRGIFRKEIRIDECWVRTISEFEWYDFTSTLSDILRDNKVSYRMYKSCDSLEHVIEIWR